MDELTAQRKTNELYSTVSNLIKRQDLEINKLSEKLNVKEDVIRVCSTFKELPILYCKLTSILYVFKNIMREERPVAMKRRPSSAFEIYCAQRRIDGAGKFTKTNEFVFFV